MSTMRAKLDAVADVDIDPEGVFKYVLIQVTASNSDEELSKKIVRGFAWAEYHADIYDAVSERIDPLGLDCECQGGGRISHKSDEKQLEVYGYSMGFGKADHSVTCGLLRRMYPGYKITWSDDDRY